MRSCFSETRDEVMRQQFKQKARQSESEEDRTVMKYSICNYSFHVDWPTPP